MTDPLYMLPLEGWAYKITDRRCSHYKDDRHKGDCSVCVREVLVEAVNAELEKAAAMAEAEEPAADLDGCGCGKAIAKKIRERKIR